MINSLKHRDLSLVNKDLWTKERWYCTLAFRFCRFLSLSLDARRRAAYAKIVDKVEHCWRRHDIHANAGDSVH